MLLGFCLASFRILFCSVVFGCLYLELLDRVVSGACFLAGGVLNCNLSHRRSVAVLCMLYKIRCNPTDEHTLCHSTCAVWASLGYTWYFDHTLMCLPIAEPRSTTGLLFPYQYLSGTIW